VTAAGPTLGILRNRAYLGEVFFRGTWYRSSPEPFVDPEVFDRVQSILDTRGERFDKRFAVRRPEYLLTGLVRCGRCERRYVGISAHGKRHRYRYYICWTRSRYGPAECDAERLRADELEAKVFDALVAVYNDGDLVPEAVEAHRSGSDGEADRVRAALSAIEFEMRKTEAAIERYMLAFEAGEVSQDRFGKRVRELEDKAAALAQRRAELSAAATATFEGFDLSDRALRRIAADLRSAADNAPDQLRKSVAQAFVDGLLVVGRRTVKPTFRLLPSVPTAPDATAAEPGGSAATGVSTKTSGVDLRCHYANTPTVAVPSIVLSPPNSPLRRGSGDR
jgi:site-specific DNA recombinase